MSFEINFKISGTIWYHLNLKITNFSVQRIKMALKQHRNDRHGKPLTTESPIAMT